MSDTAADEPITWSDVDEADMLLPLIKTLYASLHIEVMSFAIQLVLCIYGLRRYHAAKASENSILRRPYVILSFAMLGLFSCTTVADSVFVANLILNNPFGGYAEYLDTVGEPWYQTMGTMCNAIAILLADGILIYRCYFIWHNRRWVIIIPSLLWIASFIMLVVTVVSKSLLSNCAWIGLGVTANTATTALIAGRLIYERRKLSKVLAHGHLVKYVTATAILVESALPLTLLGIASPVAIIYAPDFVLLAVFPNLWLCLSVLCAQLIIFRVAVGTSYPGDLSAESEKLSRPIQFARGGSASDTRSLADLEMNGSSNIHAERGRLLTHGDP